MTQKRVGVLAIVRETWPGNDPGMCSAANESKWLAACSIRGRGSAEGLQRSDRSECEDIQGYPTHFRRVACGSTSHTVRAFLSRIVS
jgi:hypothetical protein